MIFKFLSPKQGLEDLLHLFYPQICAACSRPLLQHEKGLCSRCKRQLPRTDFHLWKGNPAERLFYGRLDLAAITSAFFFIQGGGVQQLLHRIKYQGKTEIAQQLGQRWGQLIKNVSEFSACQGIVPVPLHPKKLKKRGFNQSKAIALGLAEALGRPVLDSTLQRVQNSQTQTKLNPLERWNNVENAFVLNKGSQVLGKHILLVDDVLTTGATIEAAAKTLLLGKAKSVSVFTLAMAHKFDVSLDP